MRLFGFLQTKELEEFATGLANDLARPANESRTDAAAKHQITVILEGLAARALRYHEQHKLGLYKKAKLGNVFKWKLIELGYNGFAEGATRDIVTRLALK